MGGLLQFLHILFFSAAQVFTVTFPSSTVVLQVAVRAKYPLPGMCSTLITVFGDVFYFFFCMVP